MAPLPPEAAAPATVSVLTALFNKVDYFSATVRSVLTQEHDPLEWIVVDDGSTDGSPSLVPEGDVRVQLVAQPNRGPSQARNRAFATSSGTYVTFLDADDEYLPAKVSRQVEALERNPDASWCLCGSVRISEDPTVSDRPFVGGKSWKGGARVLQDPLREWDPSGVPVDAILLRRTCFERLGGFNEEMHCFEVTEFLTRLWLLCPSGVVIPDTLVRVHDVPDSAYKDRAQRLSGGLQKAESFLSLATAHPQHAERLQGMAHETLLDHARALLVEDRRADARRFLRKEYPGPHDRAYWTLLARTFRRSNGCGNASTALNGSTHPNEGPIGS